MRQLRRTLEHVLVASVVIACCGCTRYIAFSQSLRESSRLAPEELACLQFYLSETLVLERDVTGEAIGVEGGELVRRGGRRIHVVRIRKVAPGRLVADQIGATRVGARFGARQPTPLTFSAGRAFTIRLHGPDAHDRYAIELNGGTDGEAFREHWAPLVLYGGRRYSVASGRGAYLMIRDDAIRSVESSRTNLDGEFVTPVVLTSHDLSGEPAPEAVEVSARRDRCVESHRLYYSERGRE